MKNVKSLILLCSVLSIKSLPPSTKKDEKNSLILSSQTMCEESALALPTPQDLTNPFDRAIISLMAPKEDPTYTHLVSLAREFNQLALIDEEFKAFTALVAFKLPPSEKDKKLQNLLNEIMSNYAKCETTLYKRSPPACTTPSEFNHDAFIHIKWALEQNRYPYMSDNLVRNIRHALSEIKQQGASCTPYNADNRRRDETRFSYDGSLEDENNQLNVQVKGVSYIEDGVENIQIAFKARIAPTGTDNTNKICFNPVSQQEMLRFYTLFLALHHKDKQTMEQICNSYKLPANSFTEANQIFLDYRNAFLDNTDSSEYLERKTREIEKNIGPILKDAYTMFKTEDLYNEIDHIKKIREYNYKNHLNYKDMNYCETLEMATNKLFRNTRLISMYSVHEKLANIAEKEPEELETYYITVKPILGDNTLLDHLASEDKKETLQQIVTQASDKKAKGNNNNNNLGAAVVIGSAVTIAIVYVVYNYYYTTK